MSKIINDFRRPPRTPTPPERPRRESKQPPRRADSDVRTPVAPRRLPPVQTAAPTTPQRRIAQQSATSPPSTPKHRRLRWPLKLTKKRVIIGLIILLILIAGGVVGYLNYTASKITSGGTIVDLLSPGAKLKTDAAGRTNIVVFGTSHDDIDHQNAPDGGGLWLTDSIMLVSLDQTNNTAKMVSIPRDLWVKLDQPCAVGASSKINAVYECASDLVNQAAPGDTYRQQDADGAKALSKKIGEVTGITPHYYAHVNYSVLKDAVDAVGGIDVAIEGDGASGIYDTNFDWNCPGAAAYTCKHVYYPKDGTYSLTGTQALYLARARGDFGRFSYKNFGLVRGDFDRQINQQKILTALRTKAQSAGVLTNPIKVFSLLNALGNNITTDITTSEMKTFASALQKLPENGISSIDLAGDTPVVETASYAGQSIVQATSGPYVYTSIIELVARKFSTNPATNEDAMVAVYNGGETAGAASKLQTKLLQAGLAVTAVGNTTAVGTPTYTIYVSQPNSFPKTISYLTQNLTDVSVISTAEPSTVPTNTADIVIVINK